MEDGLATGNYMEEFRGLAPYRFEFAPTSIFGRRPRRRRVTGSYDLLLTQRLIVQPEAELNFYSKDEPSRQIGSGLSDLDTGCVCARGHPQIRSLHRVRYAGNMATRQAIRVRRRNTSDPRFGIRDSDCGSENRAPYYAVRVTGDTRRSRADERTWLGVKMPHAHGSHDRHRGTRWRCFADKFWLSFALTFLSYFGRPTFNAGLVTPRLPSPGSSLSPLSSDGLLRLWRLVFIRGAWANLPIAAAMMTPSVWRS